MDMESLAPPDMLLTSSLIPLVPKPVILGQRTWMTMQMIFCLNLHDLQLRIEIAIEKTQQPNIWNRVSQKHYRHSWVFTE